MKRIALQYTHPQLDIFFPSIPARHTIIPKGRRFGATHGAANACIEWALEGCPILWGDTVHGNVIRYVDRYFLPALKANNIDHDWKQLDKVLKVGNGYIDFRSADRPENWEGFGYRKVILNEAGIILSDPYLYTNAVRPMMLDYPDAELYALGVPKGKKLRSGDDHPFYTLWRSVGDPGYRGQVYTSYDNPLIEPKDIEELERDIMATSGPDGVRQEVYGEFIDRVAGTPFAFAFDRQRHVGKAQRFADREVYFGIDFNVEPFTATASHIWQDRDGHHWHTFAEVALKEASIKAMAEWIAGHCRMSSLVRITGDRGGMSRSIGSSGPVRMFDELRKELKLSPQHFHLPPNPPHLQSREDYNFVLSAHPDRVIDASCTRLIADCMSVEWDGKNIVKADRSKAAQQADALDCDRYVCNTYLRGWIDQHRRR